MLKPDGIMTVMFTHKAAGAWDALAGGLSGQEKYESDKERKESEKMLEDTKSQVTAHEEQAKVHEAAVSYFMQRAQKAREEADNIRNI